MVVRRFVLYATAALITVLLIAFLFLETIINAPLIKPRIVLLIEKQIGTRIDSTQMRFLVTPQPGIQVEGITLPLTRDIDLFVDAVHLDLDMRALLRKKIWISRIFLKDLRIRTAPGKDRTGLTFHDPLDLQYPGQQMERMFALLPDNANQLEVFLENSATPHFSALTGILWISKTDQTLQFDTQIQDLHVTKDWLARFFSTPDFRIDQLTSAAARLHVRLNPETGISGRLRLHRYEIISQWLSLAPVSGSDMQMHFSYLPDQVCFNLDPTRVEYPSAQVSMAFSNNRTRRETALTFQGDQIDIAQARDVSLALAPENQVVQELFDILREGAASDVLVGFYADSWDMLFEPEQLVLEGTAQNAKVKIPRTPLMTTNVNGTARVSDGILNILADNGNIDQSDMLKGELVIDLLHPSHVPFTGEFDLNVNLAQIPAVLMRLFPDTVLAEEMARVTELTGQTDARLTLTVENDQPDLYVSVATQPFSAKGYYDRIPFPLTIAKGVFVYEDDQVRVTGLSGNVGKSRVTDGTAQISITETPYLDLSVDGLDIDIQELWPELYAWQPFYSLMGPVKRVTGGLTVNGLQYKGPMFDLTQGAFNCAGTGRDIRIGFSSETHEILELSGAFDLSENRIDLFDLTAQITGMDWLPAWKSSIYAIGIALPFRLETGKVQLHENRVFVSGRALLAPNIRMSIQLAGGKMDDLAPDIILLEHKPLTDAMILFDHKPEAIQVRFEGRLDTRTLETALDKQSFLYQRLMTMTRGQPVQIVTDHASNLQVYTRLIPLDVLISQMDDSSFSGTPYVFPQKNMMIRADRLEYKPFLFSDLDARIAWGTHHPDIVLQNAGLCGTEISGRMAMDLTTPDSQAAIEMTITATNQDNIASLLSCFYPELHLMDGRYSLNAGLTGTGSINNLHKDLTGDLFFKSENGQIYKMTLLSRLLSVLNILKLPDIRQEGFRYRSIQVEAHMKNGEIHLEKAIIDAENMALFFTGEIYPFDNRLDLTCLVAPFKTIDTIVQFLPLVNTILDGRLVSFPAKATGAIDDPVITPMHPSAVGEGLVKMFTSLLQSPARLLERIP